MSEPVLDPINVHPGLHRFLYRSVFLEWETALHQRKHFPRFNARKPVAGVSLIKVEGLAELLQLHERQLFMQKSTESMIFYSKGTALKDLFKLMRNCVAHGHYSVPRKGWILFHHMHDKKLKLSGQAKFSSIKALVEAIAAGDSHRGSGHVI